MTGLYLLEGTRAVVRKSTSSKVEVGLSSAFVSALSAGSVPIGASISTGKGDEEWQLQMEMEDGHVWAAQYRLLDAKYLLGRNSEEEEEQDRKMMKISLYKDILSANTRRGAAEDGAEIGLSLETDMAKEDEAQQEEEEKAYEEYIQKLEDTIRMFEKAPPRLLNN